MFQDDEARRIFDHIHSGQIAASGGEHPEVSCPPQNGVLVRPGRLGLPTVRSGEGAGAIGAAQDRNTGEGELIDREKLRHSPS
jgi:hypothetical protein